MAKQPRMVYICYPSGQPVIALIIAITIQHLLFSVLQVVCVKAYPNAKAAANSQPRYATSANMCHLGLYYQH